jgi:hypothetical protein
MWFFKHKKQNIEKTGFNPACPYCSSNNTRIITRSNSEQADYVKVWRGQRSVTCHCLDCGRDFYTGEPAGGISGEALTGDEIVSDPEELRAAEEELNREIKDSNDRMCG